MKIPDIQFMSVDFVMDKPCFFSNLNFETGGGLYKQLMEDSPIGYAYHRIINDDEAIPCEYELIEGNAAFEKITGLNRSDMLGRRVPRIVTEIKWSEINWVALDISIKCVIK